jgi:hypothetical protein
MAGKQSSSAIFSTVSTNTPYPNNHSCTPQKVFHYLSLHQITSKNHSVVKQGQKDV